MRAVILAGGRGTRLSPYTTVIPKPLLPIGGRPILEIICRQLTAAGFTHITLALGYMSDYFQTFLLRQNWLPRDVRLDCVEEVKPTGTAGAVANIPNLHDTFLVMNGDILTTLNYRDLLRYHSARRAHLTIAYHRKAQRIDLGILELGDENRVTGYIEKPTVSHPVSMGIYVYDESVLPFIRRHEYLDFPDLVLRLLAAGRTVLGYANDASWLDLGRHEDLMEASRIMQDREQEFFPREAA
jgi:NDP-sugar pyrophosphorylase family protein